MASLLLGFLNRKRWQKVLKNCLLLLLVWLYAIVAGLSPSILRASMMISFVIIGEIIERKGFVINSIAASAFILLCVNPNNLFEIGFQLSYVAVIGIVTLLMCFMCRIIVVISVRIGFMRTGIIIRFMLPMSPIAMLYGMKLLFLQ